MGNNTVEGNAGAEGRLRSPLYSNGTPEMENQQNVGTVEGPKKGVSGDISQATVLTFEK